MLRLQCHEARIDGIAVSPDGDTIVTASSDKTAVIRNGKTTRYRALVAHDDRVNAVAYCPGRNWFATGGSDGTVRVWDDAGGTEIARFATPDVRVFAVTWAPDSRRLLCGGSDNLIHVWEVQTGRELHRLAGHDAHVRCLAFTPDGQYFASGAYEEQILVWRNDNPNPVLAFSTGASAVFGLAFSPDGRLLAAADADGTIHLWGFPSGAEVARLRGHTAQVHDVAFSPDGQRLASGSGDGTVRIWDLASRGVQMAAVSQATVAVYPWHLALEASTSAVTTIGQSITLSLRLLPEAAPGTVPLQIPANVLELTAYVEAPAFHLEGEHTRTLTVVEGKPIERALTVRVFPVSSGEQSVRFLVYPGGRVSGVGPAEVRATVSVAAPVAFPDVPELFDARAVPDPQPDVLLIVTLEETADGERMGLHLCCGTFGRERRRLDPPLDLTAREATALRRAAAEAGGDGDAAPCDVLAALRAFGRDLFHRLMPPGHPLREAFWRIRQEAALENGPLTWLILSDAAALLPWEFVCPWGVRPGTGEVWHDDFLAGTFQVAHWVGRRGFSLAAEAPFGRLDLAHYGQKPDELPQWQQALGGDEFVGVEGRAGHLALTVSGSPYHGLHLLRYSDSGAAPVTRWEGTGAEQGWRGAAETLLYERRLDFTLRRPIVGLSFVRGGLLPVATAEETALEAGWVLPFLHAGASAVVGPRSPGPDAGARLFAETLYGALRAGAASGEAVALARGELRRAFPERPDWIGYTHFGHPACRPYAVRPAEGFTLFEALDQPEGETFRAGASYRFRASYRSEAPVWFAGRLRTAADADGGEVTVMVVPLDGREPTTYRLEPAPGSADRQCVLTLAMPAEETSLPVLVRFERDGRELRTLTVTLDVAEEAHP
jgi:WD40 repeat protein